MTKLAFIGIYPGDFLADNKVKVMTAEQVGAYFLLLLAAWGEEPVGSLPNDDWTLSILARVPPEKWAEIKGRVLAPWHMVEGRLYQKRLVEEHQRAVRRVEKGRKGGLAKSLNAELFASTTTAQVESGSSNSMPMPRVKTRDREGAFAPPTLEEVRTYVAEKGYHFDPETFLAHHQNRDWRFKDGKGAKMKDWRLACVTFEKNEAKFGSRSVGMPVRMMGDQVQLQTEAEQAKKNREALVRAKQREAESEERLAHEWAATKGVEHGVS